MKEKVKRTFFALIIWSIFFVIIELSCFVSLKVYYHYRIKKSSHPKIFRDIQLYLNRFHPLFVNNDDLFARNPDVNFDPIVGYKFAPNTIQVRPYGDYMSYIEIDSEGFPHNEEYDKNKRLLSESSDKIFRVAFFGGSTTVGRGVSSNHYTVPAHFERLLEKSWPGVKFHVINTANFGYHLTEERLYYSFYIKPLKPDLIIFLDGDNDAVLAGIQEKWDPSFHDMKFTNTKYRNMFRPGKAFGNYLQSLLNFPQPLYSLFFVDKVLYKTRVFQSKTGKLKAKSEFRFHEEAVNHLNDNLLALVSEISLGKSRALFFLQPTLGVEDDLMTKKEEKNWQALEVIYPGYQKNIQGYFKRFSELYASLQKEFSNNKRINFIDISDIFKDNPKETYRSGWHSGDYGYGIIAEGIFNHAKDIVADALIEKGLISK